MYSGLLRSGDLGRGDTIVECQLLLMGGRGREAAVGLASKCLKNADDINMVLLPSYNSSD